MTRISKEKRATKANKLLVTIAGCGRRFFFYENGVGRFELDDRERIWFVDSYCNRRIYLHYKYWGKGFSEGGTLRELIDGLKDYIMTGDPLPVGHLGPFPRWLNDGDPWGYGQDMEMVRKQATKLGITLALTSDAHNQQDKEDDDNGLR